MFLSSGFEGARWLSDIHSGANVTLDFCKQCPLYSLCFVYLWVSWRRSRQFVWVSVRHLDVVLAQPRAQHSHLTVFRKLSHRLTYTSGPGEKWTVQIQIWTARATNQIKHNSIYLDHMENSRMIILGTEVLLLRQCGSNTLLAELHATTFHFPL